MVETTRSEVTQIYFIDIKHLEALLNKKDSFRFLIRNCTGTCRIVYRTPLIYFYEKTLGIREYSCWGPFLLCCALATKVCLHSEVLSRRALAVRPRGADGSGFSPPSSLAFAQLSLPTPLCRTRTDTHPATSPRT